MKRITDLTPKFKSLKPAEQELMLPFVQESMGMQMGGLSLYSKAFKRGYGDKVFGSDQNGIWLGKADFEDAPFRVDMEGNAIANSIQIATSSVISSAGGVNIDFPSSSYVDVPSSSFSVTPARPQRVVILVDVLGWVQISSGAGDWAGEGEIIIDIDGLTANFTLIRGGEIGGDAGGATGTVHAGMHAITTLSAASHTIKLRARTNQIVGATELNIYYYRISYITLGNA